MKNKDLIIEALERRIDDYVNWEPDYEEVGIQFGPSIEPALDAFIKLKKLKPDTPLPRNKRFREEARNSRSPVLRTAYQEYEDSMLPDSWGSANGDILIVDMETSHIKNVLKLLERHDQLGRPMGRALRRELDKRNAMC